MPRKRKKRPTGQAAIWFPSVEAVHAYLEAQGFKITVRSIYNHINENKLKATPKGNFTRKAVDQYAANHIAEVETGSTPVEWNLSQKKVLVEIALKEERRKREKFKREAEEGRYIPREDFARELAARAVVLENELTYMIQAHASEIIAAVNGDPSQVAALIALWTDLKNDVLNRFASTKEFQVMEAPTK